MRPDVTRQRDGFVANGWARFDHDPVTLAWADHAREAGQQALVDPAHAQWHDCEGTWFVGVDALGNDAAGRLPDGPVLDGPALAFLRDLYGPIPDLHPAQLSVMFPGYPRPKGAESPAAFRYRLNRDAAHVDGVKMYGEHRRRKVEEPHAWVLGIPLNDTSADASPLVIWEGSHLVMAEAFGRAFAGHPRAEWSDVDVTEIYTEARKQVFETCPRVTVHAKPGQSYVMHRLCLHGVAPWQAGAVAPDGEGRMIAYLRPYISGGQDNWLSIP